MNPTDDPALRLVGNWQAVLVANEAQFSYFRITADRRVFGVVPCGEPRPGKTVYIHFVMLAENITEQDFTLRFAGKEGTSVRRYYFEDGVLMLSRDRSNGGHQWQCSRVAGEDLPEYFELEYAKALEKPWS